MAPHQSNGEENVLHEALLFVGLGLFSIPFILSFLILSFPIHTVFLSIYDSFPTHTVSFFLYRTNSPFIVSH